MRDTAPESMILHVGHNKTGSTFLQTGLANSAANLERHGLSYPIGDKLRHATDAGKIVGGNISAGQDVPKLFASNTMQSRVLLSSEAYFNKFRNDKQGRNPLLETLTDFVPADRIRVLLLIRDPLEHAISHYHQVIKSGTRSETFDEFLARYNMPKNVKSFLLDLESHDLKYDIINYSRHKSDLSDTFGRCLGVPAGTIQTSRDGPVNRSLTGSELELQRLLNKYVGAGKGNTVGTALAYQLPGIKSDAPAISRDGLRAGLERIQGQLDDPELKSRIPEEAAYQLESFERAADRLPDVDPDRSYSFSAEQMEVIAKAINRTLKAQSGQAQKGKRNKS